MDAVSRILIADDEPNITDLLVAALQFEGFATQVAKNGAEALLAARAGGHDLAILDVMLPDISGIDVCSRLRDEGIRMPVLFLTALDAIEDKVAGLGVGGDDYITKPFSLDELLARIRAVLRRTQGEATTAQLRFADLVLDEASHEVFRAGRPVELTATEFSLLHFLMSNARRVLSKDQILDAVWGYGFDGDKNIVETYVSYLRKKIDVVEPTLIQTVRGVGYTLRLRSS
ncbi:MAG: response regulator transcription factor [Actinobacteria bacterium]|nr:response regulator transcription factor [Actinomycetota bacterium]